MRRNFQLYQLTALIFFPISLPYIANFIAKMRLTKRNSKLVIWKNYSGIRLPKTNLCHFFPETNLISHVILVHFNIANDK